MSKFSDRLLELCKSKGISQAALAREMGVDKSTINKYVLGKREPDFAFIEKLVAKFGVSTDYLYGISDDPKTQILADPEDAELLVSASEKLREYETLPDTILALNSLMYQFGYEVKRLQGKSEYCVFTNNGFFEIDEEMLIKLVETLSCVAKEKIDYYEMENRLKLINEINTQHHSLEPLKVPVITTVHDSDLYARHLSKREQQELAAELANKTE